MGEATPLDIHFPFAGINVISPVYKQPNQPAVNGDYARTVAIGINVRSFDHTERSRGGSRQGITRYVNALPGGVNYITQGLGILTTTGINAPGGGNVQQSNSGRLVLLIAVSQGNVWTVPAGETSYTQATNLTGETPPLNATGLVYSASNNQLQFFADGINQCYYDPTDNSVHTWTPTDGIFPADASNNKPRLICTWRGRTVLSGILKDPTLICMTKVSDPFNFNYAPPVPVPADSAWSGRVGQQGLVPEAVTALIPYTDDILIIGMNNQLAIFQGDPNAGGSIDNVTTSIGIAWGNAWCMDSQGIIYFFSNRCGVFQFIPGQQPQRISQPIDPLLNGIDTGLYTITLQWNERYQQLHVWVTLTIQPSVTTHYCWEARPNAWWTDQFANAQHNPICCVNFDGNLQSDRLSLIGSWDGYVRSVSSNAIDDDGTPINSEVWIGPVLTKFNDAVQIEEVQGVIAQNSQNVDYEIHLADTAEEALSSDPVAAGTWVSGRNYTDTVKRTGYADYIRLTAVGQWALENIRMTVRTAGKVRQRGKV